LQKPGAIVGFPGNLQGIVKRTLDSSVSHLTPFRSAVITTSSHANTKSRDLRLHPALNTRYPAGKVPTSGWSVTMILL
jgi:hypothetical protein